MFNELYSIVNVKELVLYITCFYSVFDFPLKYLYMTQFYLNIYCLYNLQLFDSLGILPVLHYCQKLSQYTVYAADSLIQLLTSLYEPTIII